jgi:hypothetical protein
MASMAQKVGLVVLGGALGSGGTLGLSELSKSRGDGTTPPAAEVKKSYIEIDRNTFVIEGSSTSAESFGKDLAQFRKEHWGDFVFIPANATYPTRHVLAVRKDIKTDDGRTNSIITQNK